MALTWLITRPLEDALPMVEALSAKGVAALAVPCIERVALPWSWSWADQGDGEAGEEGSRLQAPGSRNSVDPQVQGDGEEGAWQFAPGPRNSAEPRALRVVMITSGAVVSRLAERRAELDGVTLAALAPVTAAKLRAAGFTVGVEAEGGVRELAAAVARWAGGRRLQVLYPTSDLAEQQAEHQEALAGLARVARVRVAPVYSTRPVPGLAAALAAAPRPFGLFLASPSAVEACVAALDQAVGSRLPAPGSRKSEDPHVPSPRARGEGQGEGSGDDEPSAGAGASRAVPEAGSEPPGAEPGAHRLQPSAAVLHGASTLRAWKQYAPAHWPHPVPYDRTHELAATLLATGATP